MGMQLRFEMGEDGLLVTPNLLYPAKTLAYQSIAANLPAYPDTGTLLPAYPDMGLG